MLPICGNCAKHGVTCDFSKAGRLKCKQDTRVQSTSLGSKSIDKKQIACLKASSFSILSSASSLQLKNSGPQIFLANIDFGADQSNIWTSSPIFFLAGKQCASGKSFEHYVPKVLNLGKDDVITQKEKTILSPTLITPHPNIMKVLAQEYFRYFNPYVPIIEPSLFFQYLNDPNPSLPKQALITAVCLSGVCYYSHKSIIKDISQVLIERLCSLFTKIYYKPCTYTVQAFLLASQWQISQQNSRILKNSWYYYSLSCNMARMLGFHKRNTFLDKLLQDERTRIWMVIYITGVAYNIGIGKHYSISFANTDVPLWALDISDEGDKALYNKNKHIVNTFRNSVVFAAIVEMVLQIKRQFKSLIEGQSKTSISLADKKKFHTMLNSAEKCIFSWYITLPSYLYSKAKKHHISVPSHRNQFSCRLHITVFHFILEINHLKLELQNWAHYQISGILDDEDQIRKNFSIQEFLSLPTLEKCIVAAHFGVLTLFSPRRKKEAFHGPAFKWVYGFQFAMFLKLLKKNGVPPCILAIIKQDEDLLLGLFMQGASRLSILKDSLEILTNSGNL
ncbi:Transcriptional activator of fatty acid utilization [Entomophthora muscae]|uniref:Transcriptional activator of fatty acid utilization n=1 Tax=Entomophthora muscae TaxID=34485 RepID=A0ACC2UP66_9FUNG|nr:Transcriptional activator of fatty acid utilization [Entomophthora muscae]